MPWTINSPPSVAKNWTDVQKRKCVSAANAALRDGKSDQEAIFACIGAAGKGKKQVDDEQYDDIVAEGAGTFQDLVELFLVGAITAAVLRSRFRDALRLHYIRLMLAAKGDVPPTAADYAELERRLAIEYALLDNFINDLIDGTMTDMRAMYRARMYAPARGAFIQYTLPADIIGLMPVIPGDDCLGDGLCHCHLSVEYSDDGTAFVYWVLDPASESCEVCIAHALESPFVFTAEALQNA